MAYINLDPGYFDHWKTKRLVGLLGKGSESLPIKLWAHYATAMPKGDGRMTGYSAQEIESCVGWWGKSGDFVDAMLKVQLFEQDGTEFILHDWIEHQGHIRALKLRSEAMNRKRWSKMSRQDSCQESVTESVTESSIQSIHPNQSNPSPSTMAMAMPDELDERISEFIRERQNPFGFGAKQRAMFKLAVERDGFDAVCNAYRQAEHAGARDPTSYAVKILNSSHDDAIAKVSLKPARQSPRRPEINGEV